MNGIKTSTPVEQHNPKLDVQGFSVLHDQYRNRLLNSMTGLTKNREMAEDITAIAFAAALENLASFDARSSFYTWLHAIAMNAAKNSWRRNRSISLMHLCRINRRPHPPHVPLR